MESWYQGLVDSLNDRDCGVRLESLRQLIDAVKSKKIPAPVRGDYVNNHIHTTYSFSPYSPSRAVWEAYRAGLQSAGIMDHDSIRGAREFIEAGSIAGIATTIGVECRVDFSGTTLNGRRINNPDQLSNAYIALHGIPHTHIDEIAAYFEPLIVARQKRNRAIVDLINTELKPFGIELDYIKDVQSISQNFDGGTVTERHVLFALANKLIQSFGKGTRLIDFLQFELGLSIESKIWALLQDEKNRFYEYDLLGLLKSEYISHCWIGATDECPSVYQITALAKQCHCICAYAYLGDVGTSATGDKKTQRFEDEYIEEVFLLIKEIGFTAVTYMPTRNTIAQLERVMELCRRYDLFQISGEDINSPRQSFQCVALHRSEFKHLVDATWALIGHEMAATNNECSGFFEPGIISKYPDLNDRIRFFREIGLSSAAEKSLRYSE
jgi:hypothetical protein